MYKLYVDGGGQTIKEKVYPTYFSCKAFKNGVEINDVSLEIWFLKSLVPYKQRTLLDNHLMSLPINCSIYNDKHKETNNIAEYAALYYGLLRFYRVCKMVPVTVFHDSQLVIKQVTNTWPCKKYYLQPWHKAIKNLKWVGVNLEWKGRDGIIPILGH